VRIQGSTDKYKASIKNSPSFNAGKSSSFSTMSLNFGSPLKALAYVKTFDLPDIINRYLLTADCSQQIAIFNWVASKAGKEISD